MNIKKEKKSVKTKKVSNVKSVTLRLTPELVKLISESAKKNSRTFANQCLIDMKKVYVEGEDESLKVVRDCTTAYHAMKIDFLLLREFIEAYLVMNTETPRKTGVKINDVDPPSWKNIIKDPKTSK